MGIPPSCRTFPGLNCQHPRSFLPKRKREDRGWLSAEASASTGQAGQPQKLARICDPVGAALLFQRAVLQQLLKQPPGVAIADADGGRRLLNPRAVELLLRNDHQIARQTLDGRMRLRVVQNDMRVLQLLGQIAGLISGFARDIAVCVNGVSSGLARSIQQVSEQKAA